MARYGSESPVKESAPLPVVVLNVHHSGLGIARDLGPLGVRVIGVSAEARFPGNRSRWLEFRRMPDSLLEPKELLVSLRGLAEELGCRAILFPTRDHDVHFINAHRLELDSLFTVPAARPEVMSAILDKSRLAEVAARVGIAVPRGIAIASSAELEGAQRLRFPVVCKPVSASQWRRPGMWEAVKHQKAIRFENYDALCSFYESIAPLDPKVVVQEWVHGEDVDLQIFGSWCRQDHEVGAYFTARKRIQYPTLLGTGIAVEAMPLPDLEAPSRRLLRELGYHGISEIEYKRDRRTGRLYLIEVNPRHWDQHRLGSAVGVSLSRVAYQESCGGTTIDVRQRDEHVVWVAEPELLRHILRVLTGRAKPAGLVSLLRRMSYAIASRSDRAPMWAAIREAVRTPFR